MQDRWLSTSQDVERRGGRSATLAGTPCPDRDISPGRLHSWAATETATRTGKPRTAAAFVKRLFEASIFTRVLLLVDRIALAEQAEDAFTDHLRDHPCHVHRPGRGVDRILSRRYSLFVPKCPTSREVPANDPVRLGTEF